MNDERVECKCEENTNYALAYHNMNWSSMTDDEQWRNEKKVRSFVTVMQSDIRMMKYHTFDMRMAVQCIKGINMLYWTVYSRYHNHNMYQVSAVYQMTTRRKQNCGSWIFVDLRFVLVVYPTIVIVAKSVNQPISRSIPTSATTRSQPATTITMHSTYLFIFLLYTSTIQRLIIMWNLVITELWASRGAHNRRIDHCLLCL